MVPLYTVTAKERLGLRGSTWTSWMTTSTLLYVVLNPPGWRPVMTTGRWARTVGALAARAPIAQITENMDRLIMSCLLFVDGDESYLRMDACARRNSAGHCCALNETVHKFAVRERRSVDVNGAFVST